MNNNTNQNDNVLAKRLQLAERMIEILQQKLRESDIPDIPPRKDLNFTDLQNENDNYFINIIRLQEERILNLESQINDQYHNNDKESYINFLERRIKQLNDDLHLYYQKLADIQNERIALFQGIKMFGRENAIKNFDMSLNRLKIIVDEEEKFLSEMATRNRISSEEFAKSTQQLSENQSKLDQLMENMKFEYNKKKANDENLQLNVQRLVEIDEDLRKDIFRLLVILNEANIDSEEIRQFENKYFSNQIESLT